MFPLWCSKSGAGFDQWTKKFQADQVVGVGVLCAEHLRTKGARGLGKGSQSGQGRAWNLQGHLRYILQGAADSHKHASG